MEGRGRGGVYVSAELEAQVGGSRSRRIELGLDSGRGAWCLPVAGSSAGCCRILGTRRPGAHSAATESHCEYRGGVGPTLGV